MSRRGSEIARIPGDCAQGAPRGRACFLIVGQGTLRTVELAAKASHVVGSDPAADIRLIDPAVARQHAILKFRPDGKATIVPVSIDCPMLVNLRFVEGQVALSDGDLVSIGSMTLTYHDIPRSLWHELLDLEAFRQRLERRLDVGHATGARVLMVSMDLARERTGALGPQVFEEMGALLDDDALVGWDGTSHVRIAVWLAQEAPEQVCERLCQGVHKCAPLDAVGVAVFPNDATNVKTLLALSHQNMRPMAQLHAPQSSPMVRTLQVGEHVVHFMDPAMRQLFDSLECLSTTDLPVLIQGETGVGKDLIAHTLHEWSPRRDKPLVTLNCAAIADTLVENELFGHEPGAFTGAGKTKQGLLESASGGTVFLDEIGECSPQIQAKLLRVLETRRVSRLGSVKERRIDVRWVAATNRDLKREVAEGRFRSDLLFRLNAASVQVPPLRSRRVEIPLLARTFLERACLRSGRAAPAISLVVNWRLVEYSWPGNVRELRSLMEYLAATTDGPEIEEQHLPPEILAASRTPEEGTPPGLAALTSAPLSRPGGWSEYPGLYDEVRRLEERRIREALMATGSVRMEAARLLGMPLRTFHTKLKEYGIS